MSVELARDGAGGDERRGSRRQLAIKSQLRRELTHIRTKQRNIRVFNVVSGWRCEIGHNLNLNSELLLIAKIGA